MDDVRTPRVLVQLSDEEALSHADAAVAEFPVGHNQYDRAAFRQLARALRLAHEEAAIDQRSIGNIAAKYNRLREAALYAQTTLERLDQLGANADIIGRPQPTIRDFADVLLDSTALQLLNDALEET